MGQKRTPALMAIAKRLRNAGHSYASIATELSKPGKTVSKAAVIGWLRSSEAPDLAAADAPSPAATPAPAAAPAPEPPAERPDDPEMTPDEVRRVLSTGMRRAQAAADAAADVGDAAEAKAQAKIVAIFAGHLRQIHNKADEDTDTIKVRAGGIEAAADRALAGLRSIADRVVADVQACPACPACGRHAVSFAAGDVSPLRALMERVARGG